MKYILNERQYLLLLEQSNYEKGIWDRSAAMLDRMENIDPHVLLGITSIATAFIPLVGPLLSTGISLLDASLYYKEGDKSSAALVAGLSMIPFLGGVVTKIPGVKELGAKGMAALGKKLAEGAKNLSGLELKIANAINSNKELIIRELKLATSRLPEVQKYINAYKKSFISKYGQQAYDESLRRLFNGTYTKQQFIDRLKAVNHTVGQFARLGTLKGIKFTEHEIKTLDDLVRQVGKTKKLKTVIDLGGKRVYVYFDEFDGTFRGSAQETTNQIWMNMKNLTSPEEIKSVLYHEAAHIKDAAMKSPKLQSNYTKIMTEKQKVLDYIDNATSLSQNAKEELLEKYTKLFNKYKTHPFEITANNQMLINNLSSFVINSVSKKTPQKIISKLDKLLSSLKQNQKIIWDEYLDILGMDGLAHLTYLKINKPQDYNILMKKLYQQISLTKKELGLMK